MVPPITPEEGRKQTQISKNYVLRHIVKKCHVQAYEQHSNFPDRALVLSISYSHMDTLICHGWTELQPME